ncbi:hypothetical protein NQ117_21335 [Paenibacillus sp. SC116]|uniref:hypothetical protein n=1 Tax=Paenibacillus sp. SC116 TaxID=2968986 RepID=UPI00215A1320|nr:hypothetical protein [Paenibacillus sp. SC116]MCR8846231.1 hypothetical protein [Paenibacillus sp. SC116]
MRVRSRGRGRRSPLIVVVLLFMLIVWPSYQIYNLLHENEKSVAVERLLYEAAYLNVQMLEGAMREAQTSLTAVGWNEWKTNAYAAQYVHERLRQAVGEDRVPELAVFEKMVDLITVVQINGDRQLKEQERKQIADAAAAMPIFVERYGQFMTEQGKVLSSKAEELETLASQILLEASESDTEMSKQQPDKGHE